MIKCTHKNKYFPKTVSVSLGSFYWCVITCSFFSPVKTQWKCCEGRWQEGELAVWELNTVAHTGEMLSILLIRFLSLSRKYGTTKTNKKKNKAAEISYRNTGNNFVWLYLPGRCIILNLRVANDRRGSASLSLWAAGDMCIWTVLPFWVKCSLNLSILLMKYSSSQCGKQGSCVSLAFSLDAEPRSPTLP